MSDDAQRNQGSQQNDVQGYQRAHGDDLLLQGQVIDQICTHEEGDVSGDEYGPCTPPWIDPDEGGSPCQENLKHRAECGKCNAHEDAAVDAKDLGVLVLGQQLAGEAGHAEHQGQLCADADQENEAGALGGDGPQGIAGEMADDRIGDFVQPVDGIEHGGTGHGLVVLGLDLGAVGGHHQCEKGEDGPVEIGRVTDGGNGPLSGGSIGPGAKQHRYSSCQKLGYYDCSTGGMG